MALSYDQVYAYIALHYVLSDVRGQVFGTDPYVNH